MSYWVSYLLLSSRPSWWININHIFSWYEVLIKIEYILILVVLISTFLSSLLILSIVKIVSRLGFSTFYDWKIIFDIYYRFLPLFMMKFGWHGYFPYWLNTCIMIIIRFIKGYLWDILCIVGILPYFTFWLNHCIWSNCKYDWVV